MGLADMTVEELEKAKEFLKMLSFFGITEEDLRFLPEAIQIVKNMKNNKSNLVENTRIALVSDEEKKKIEQAFKDKGLDLMFEQFTREEEEFYPHGRPKN